MSDKKDKPLGEQLGWHLEDTTYLFESPWYNLRQDKFRQDRFGQGNYTYIEHPGSVFIVPLTADRRILLIRSYRFTLDEWCWEVPAGSMGDRVDLSPEEVALEELKEEAGATCQRLERLGKFYLGNGYANHSVHFFLASGAEQTVAASPESLEEIAEVTAFSLRDIRRMLREGMLTDGDSAFALLLALHYLAEI